MNKKLLLNLKLNRLLTWPVAIILTISLLSFTGDGPNPKKADYEYAKRRHYLANTKPISPHFNSDPIRFTLKTDKKQVSLGDEVTFTITAYYLNISPALLFASEGSNAFRLKLLFPDGFVQTGGSYSDYVGTELSSARATVTYTLKGYFTKAQNRNEFRLLRGSGSANETSLFVEKAILSISVNDHAVQNKNGRLASNCDYTEGQFLLNWYGEQIYAHYYNGVLFASYQDPSQGFKPQSWLQSTGFDISKVGCFAVDDPHTSTTPTPNPPVVPPAGNCGFAEGQFLLNWYGEQIYAHYYNGVLFASYQDPSQGFKPQSWLQSTGLDATKTSCFAISDPHTTNPTTPTTNPPVVPPAGTCSVSSPNAAFDFADCNGIGGWALDQANMNQPVLIDIYVDGVKTYAGITASGDRQDLVGAFGNSAARYHGFSYSFPANASWKNGQNHTISVRICGVNNDIGGSPKTVSGCTGGTNNPTTPTTNPPTANCGTGSGLTGFYSNSSDLSGNLAAVRNDAQINFTWGDSPIPGVVNADGFSIRWFGKVEAPVSGNYTFKTNNDDGTRVWVNGQLLIDDWNGHGPTWQQGSVYLNGGQKYDIVIDYFDYFDYWGGAQAQLYWEYPGQSLQLVPTCRLYSNLRYDQASQTYRSVVDDQICGGGNIDETTIGCAVVYSCKDSGRIFAMNLKNCEGVDGPPGGTPVGAPPGDTPNGIPISVGPTPTVMPGGPTNPHNPGFTLPTTNISPVFTDKSIDDYTAIEILVAGNRILKTLGLTSIDQLDKPDFPPILYLEWINDLQKISRETFILKQMHPDWGDYKCLIVAYKNVYSGKVHFLLDAFGVIPGAGEVADGVNGGIYLLEGDNTNAALSLAAMMPIGGWAATGGKWARNALKYDGFYDGAARYVSQHGLNFTLYGRAENRLDHVLLHTKDVSPTSNKSLHGVFYGTTATAISSIDEAWEIIKRNNIQPTIDPMSGNWNYILDMGKVIGWEGGKNGSKGPLTKILIATKPNNDAILVTAFPSR